MVRDPPLRKNASLPLANKPLVIGKCTWGFVIGCRMLLEGEGEFPAVFIVPEILQAKDVSLTSGHQIVCEVNSAERSEVVSW